MTIPASVLRQLATLGLSDDLADAVAGMLSAVEEATKADSAKEIDARRANDRERKSRQRHGMSRDITGHHGTERDTSASPKERFHTSKETTPSTSTSEPDGSSVRIRAAKRGVRVDGFEPDLLVAESMGLTPERARFQREKFLDFWRGKPGASGLKLDWPATWRNWIREEVDRNGSTRSPHGQGPPKPKRTGDRIFDRITDRERAANEQPHPH